MPIQSVNPANGVLLRSFTPLTSEALLGKIALAQDRIRGVCQRSAQPPRAAHAQAREPAGN
jgi:hypothetical protein